MFVRVMNRGAAAAAEEEQPYCDYAWNELLPLTGGVHWQIMVVVAVFLAALWISWSTVTVVSRREHWKRR